MSSTQFTLYGHEGHGPNPPKVAILLELLGLTYKVIAIPFGEKGVKSATYLKLNPNGRVPYLIDHANNDFGVWESGACLYYLCERYDKEGKYFGKTLEEKTEVIQWVAYQISGIGPSQGNVNWYNLYHEKVHGEPASASVLKRYRDETDRIYNVLEAQLTKQEQKGVKYIAIDRLTIADIAYYVWFNIPELGGPYLEGILASHPKIVAYAAQIRQMPAVQAAEDKIHHAEKRQF